jgi:hypothetical protein
MRKRHIIVRVAPMLLGIIAIIFGSLLLFLGISLLERWPLRRAEGVLPQVREDFILMQPHLDTLMRSFPNRTLIIAAPTERDGAYFPLRILYTIHTLRSGTVIESHYRHDYSGWYALDWFPQEAIDAAVFLTSSPYLSHTLSEIMIEPFGLGSSTLIANIELDMGYPVAMVIFRGYFYSRPADAYVSHREELGGGYNLRIQIYMLGAVLGRFVIGFGVIAASIGAIIMKFSIVKAKEGNPSTQPV